MTTLVPMTSDRIARRVARMRETHSVLWIACQLDRSTTWVYRMLRRAKGLPRWPTANILVYLERRKK